MIRYLLATLALLLITLGEQQPVARTQVTTLPYHDVSVTLPYLYQLAMQRPLYLPSPEALSNAATAMQKQSIDQYVSSLRNLKKEHALNDFMLAELILNSARHQFPRQTDAFLATHLWHVLNQLGYSASLYYNDHTAQVFIKTKEMVYGVPVLQYGEDQYVNLSRLFDLEYSTQGRLMAYGTMEGSGKASFSFRVAEVPHVFKKSYITKNLSFQHEATTYSVPVKSNRGWLQYLYNYPQVSFITFSDCPFSQSAEEHLLGWLATQIEGMNEYEKVRFLLSFTRSAFNYGTEDERFGPDKALAPELTLFSKQSDCEDRAILFRALVQRLVGDEVVFLDYPTHISAAVQFKSGQLGDPVWYNQKAYTVCEPTGPQNHLGIGEYPPGMPNDELEVYAIR